MSWKKGAKLVFLFKTIYLHKIYNYFRSFIFSSNEIIETRY